MFNQTLSPIFFRIAGLEIRYYGIAYVIGFIILFFVINKFLETRVKEEKRLQKTAELFLYLFFGLILGSRIITFLFYYPTDFLKNPLTFFYIWQGGMSFHGGLLGSVIAGYLFCKKNKINSLELFDRLVILGAFVLFFGRLANFLNSENYGIITSLSWCVNFPGVAGCRHPVQLYESAANLVLFFILLYMRKKRVKKGIVSFSFLFLYSFFRFFIDIFREYEAVYFGLGAGQWLNIVGILAGLFFLVRVIRKNS